jgi:hypothetical protein
MRFIFQVAKMLASAMLVVLTQAALASDWKQYDARSYGFSMLVPSGVQVREREWGGGWGGLNADFEGVKLYGLAKLGAKATNAEIEAFAVRTIGIPASEWTQVDAGTNQRGWERYKVFRATRGAKLYYGGYGVGPKGNYLLYLETTSDDYNAHKADYHHWYESIRLE